MHEDVRQPISSNDPIVENIFPFADQGPSISSTSTESYVPLPPVRTQVVREYRTYSTSSSKFPAAAKQPPSTSTVDVEDDDLVYDPTKVSARVVLDDENAHFVASSAEEEDDDNNDDDIFSGMGRWDEPGESLACRQVPGVSSAVEEQDQVPTYVATDGGRCSPSVVRTLFGDDEEDDRGPDSDDDSTLAALGLTNLYRRAPMVGFRRIHDAYLKVNRTILTPWK